MPLLDFWAGWLAPNFHVGNMYHAAKSTYNSRDFGHRFIIPFHLISGGHPKPTLHQVSIWPNPQFDKSFSVGNTAKEVCCWQQLLPSGQSSCHL
jgi:hypothetical protein